MDDENKTEPQENTEPETEPKTEPQTEPTGDEGGKPDAAKAAEKYKAQRDEARQQIADLEKQMAEYKGNDEIITKLQADLKKTREEAEAQAKKAEADRVNSNRLTKAGCVDVDVALGLLDENGDVDKLMEQKPYLFTKKGSTGLPPSGQGGDAASIARAREAAGLPPIKD
ncbi:hypothetical protein Ccur_02750 [Cryptobacterium curtum DSM 15641]|uniref:Phage minor structural protein GP20 n=1 Tax=Cryptobacterium curtum (strain ATCC 700683 / DSM 15641 / CCUG 43107 / 12-3) TaxID=469378 RepID=C7MM62_CRYCD|nr:hypothetical protein [Cryptobacterium curtum]ACU94002.1 hypothetical protein Ccur_02750 [Cryptobacterium curtum DSM 15641]